jgi:hypothetical protein
MVASVGDEVAVRQALADWTSPSTGVPARASSAAVISARELAGKLQQDSQFESWTDDC